MLVEDNTLIRRKAIKDISIGECFKIPDEPFMIYLRIDCGDIPGLKDDYIPCVKIMSGKVDLLPNDRLVYPVKSKLIVGEDSYDKEITRKLINDKIDGFVRQMNVDLHAYMFDENGNSTQLKWDIKQVADEYKKDKEGLYD